MIIYKVTNLVDGKCYIGQTSKNLNIRINSHVFHSKKTGFYFHNALRKYGIDNFRWEIIKECQSRKELNNWEEQYIQIYNALFPDGYNLTTGGEGFNHCEKTKLKLRRLNKGKNHPLYGKKLSEETKKKMSISRKGRKRKPFSKEWRKNRSELLKKLWANEEYRKKQIKAHIGKKFSIEQKKNMSIAQKKRPPVSEETKKRLSESLKRSWAKRE